MGQIPCRPPDWREKAHEYAGKAEELTDVQLYRQYVELAARYLEMARKTEYQPVSQIARRVNAKDR